MIPEEERNKEKDGKIGEGINIREGRRKQREWRRKNRDEEEVK